MHQQPVEFFNRRQFLQRSAMVSLMGLGCLAKSTVRGNDLRRSFGYPSTRHVLQSADM